MTYINLLTLNTNRPKIVFREAPTPTMSTPAYTSADSFVTNPLSEKLGSVQEIEARARANPEIMRILNENKIPLKVNIKALEELQSGHLKNARINAAKIYSSLPEDLKRGVNGVQGVNEGVNQGVNMSNIQQAAMFHDIGKVLIPENILNKKGKLTEEERKIMETHSELGYELLKNTGLNKDVLNIIKYHHQNPTADGYPKTGQDFNYNLELDILRAADEYTALREERPYKSALSKQEALSIIEEDVKKGYISPEVYNALEKSAS